MNEETNQEILSELREMRKVARRVFYLAVVLVVVALLSFPLPRRFRGSSPTSPAYEISWGQVDEAMKQQDFRSALAVASALVKREPNYYYGHAYLASIYMAMSDVTNAEQQMLRAYELFPTEEAHKELLAIRRRLPGAPPLLEMNFVPPTKP